MVWTLQLDNVDFDANRATFVIPDNFRACAGNYVVMLNTDFEKMEQEKLDTDFKKTIRENQERASQNSVFPPQTWAYQFNKEDK